MKRSWIKRSQPLKRSNWIKKQRTESIRRKAASNYRLRAGRKTKEWNKVRAQLKIEHEKQGITVCELGFEGCWRDNALSFAHGRKRRKLQEGELKELTILCCIPCHDKIEYLGPEKMLEIVEETIAKRAA